MWTLIIPLIAGDATTEHRIEYPTQQECHAGRAELADQYDRVLSRVYSGDPWRDASLRSEAADQNDQPPGVDRRWRYQRAEIGYCLNTEVRLSR